LFPDKVGGQLPLINELSVALKPERFFQAHFETMSASMPILFLFNQSE
jgi:hypothetical protein